MKLKKGMIAIALLLTMCMTQVVLTACGNDLDPITDKNEAIEMLYDVDGKMDELTNYSMTISGGGRQSGVDVTMSGTIKITDDELSLEMESGTIGMTMQFKIYYSDGYLYTMMPGSKTKTATLREDAIEEMFEQFGTSSEDDTDTLAELKDESWVFEGTSSKSEYIFTFTKGNDVQVYKVHKNEYFTYLSRNEDGMEIVMTVKTSTPSISLPSDLDTYVEM